MVVTTLGKEAAPLIRYRTRDLTRLLPDPCPCGSPLPRHDRILGRSDDMIIFRAVNIYPGQVDDVLSKIPGLGSEYQIHLMREKDGKDYMTVKVERAQEAPAQNEASLAEAIKRGIKTKIMVSAQVELMDFGSLPRTDRKSKRVFDNRLEE
jgi:phenylacetate-CoA ligase